MRNYSDDDDEYNQELHDKSTELWSGAVKKRQKVMENLTPNYQRSKRVQNKPNQSVSGIMDKQLDSIKQKLNTQKSASKQKDLEIQNLKQKINQLNKDKKILLGQIEMKHSQQIPQKTINFQKTQQNLQSYRPQRRTKNKSQIAESIQDISQQKLQDLPKYKIIELLRSTSEYQSFANYHDSHRLIFLKDFHDSKKSYKQENRGNNQWSEHQILQEMSKLNQKQNLGLNYHNQSIIIKRMKDYYDKQFEQKAKKLRVQYQTKIKKATKESSSIPQDLNQIRKVKQGELAQQMAHKKMKSLKK